MPLQQAKIHTIEDIYTLPDIYNFQGDDAGEFSFSENVAVGLYPDFLVNISSMI